MIDILFLLAVCASGFTLCFALVTKNRDMVDAGIFGISAVLVVAALYYGITGRVGLEWLI